MQLELIAKETLVPLLAVFHQLVEKVAFSFVFLCIFPTDPMNFLVLDFIIFQTGL